MTHEIAEAAGMALSRIDWALSLDACIILLLLILKAFLFAGIIILVSRNEAHRSRKFFVFMVFFLGSILALLNPASNPVGMTRAVLSAVLISTLLVKKVCWIDIEKAFLGTFLYCLLTVAINIYSTYGLDLLIKDRPTIGRFLTARLDERTLRLSEDYTFDPSPTLLSAGLRAAAASTSDEGGFVSTLLSPIRAGMKVKETIEEIGQVAETQAAIVNMLSGAGTNVGSRAEELASLKEQMSKEAANGTGVSTAHSPPSGQQVPAHPPPAETTPVPPAAALADAFTKGLSLRPTDKRLDGNDEQPVETFAHTPGAAVDGHSRDEHRGSPASVEVAVTAGLPTNAPPALPPPESEPSDLPTNGVAVIVDAPTSTKGTWADLPPAARRRWSAARDSIKVSAAGRSSRGAYVMVGSHFVAQGSVYCFDFRGTNYAFRLTDVMIPNRCEWEPVPDAPMVVDDALLTF